MRVPVTLAWLLVLLGFFTAGLLRQFHAGTPRSPFVSPTVGSALFAAIFLLLLVSAREWRRGAVPGRGIRLGSLTPLLLMLLIEKWVSLSFYVPAFDLLTPAGLAPAMADARFRAFAGIGLILICLLVARMSAPTARKTWRRARPLRWPTAAVQAALVIAGTYAVLGLTAWALGGRLRLHWPRLESLLIWIVLGQAVLAFAEEVYYRGLLMSETERLAPRLGARNPAARRWIALVATSVVFGMEHLSLHPSWADIGRQMIFTVSLGLLLGLLVMVSANLHLAGGIHAWINCLLLGATPYFVNDVGEPALPAGTYIGLTLILAFISTYLAHRWRSRRRGKWGHSPLAETG